MKKFKSIKIGPPVSDGETFSTTTIGGMLSGNSAKAEDVNSALSQLASNDARQKETINTLSTEIGANSGAINVNSGAIDAINAQNVTEIKAGTNVTIDPVGGTGVVTINSTGGGGGVTSVKHTAPITDTGTATEPNIGFDSNILSGIVENTSSINTLSTEIDANSGAINVNSGGIVENTTNINTLSTEIDANSGAIDAINAQNVTEIKAGTNVTIEPVGGTGVVTINSTGGGGGSVTSVKHTAPITDTGTATEPNIGFEQSVIDDINANSKKDGVPTGGTTSQVLAKKSNDDGDVDWEDTGATTPSYGAISILGGGLFIEANIPNDVIEFKTDTPTILVMSGDSQPNHLAVNFNIHIPALYEALKNEQLKRGE